jgi:hypothetical protein
LCADVVGLEPVTVHVTAGPVERLDKRIEGSLSFRRPSQYQLKMIQNQRSLDRAKIPQYRNTATNCASSRSSARRIDALRN